MTSIDSAALALQKTFDAEHHDLRAIAWSPDGQSLLGISGNATAWIWDLATGKVRWEVKIGIGVPSCLAWSPDGRYWLAGTWQGHIELCGATSGAEYVAYRGLSGSVIGV